jgi:branched-chain amino acid transport system ATP-binding protein
MLKVQGLHAGYGPSPVLHGLQLTVQPGEIVALLGRNGAGLVERRGQVAWQGRDLSACPPYVVAQAGIGYVPESRDIFPTLTVQQNLLLGCKPGVRPAPGGWTLEDAYRLFPALRQRQHTAGGVLSGGEQQMLTLCRSLMGQPGLMLIDEPAEGLAPRLVAQLAAFLRELRGRGLGVLLVEQKLNLALDVADRCLVMGQGRIVFEGTPAALRADEAVRSQWLAV